MPVNNGWWQRPQAGYSARRGRGPRFRAAQCGQGIKGREQQCRADAGKHKASAVGGNAGDGKTIAFVHGVVSQRLDK